VVSDDPQALAVRDARIRPNAIIALAVEPRLFDARETESMLAVAKRELVTPAGLRTLARTDKGYRGHYGGGVKERDRAYHEGTVWPFLLGFYVRAAIRHRPHDAAHRDTLIRLVSSAADNCLALGQVPELADGDPPHRPSGCVAQAWSVAELLRALAWDLA
jgi:glycogen debranching enzyme